MTRGRNDPCRRRLMVEALEHRRLLATITGAEMEFIYDLNFARHDPEAYDDAISQPGLLDGVAPKPPLAVNDQLVASAEFHSHEMATENYFGHTSPSGKQPNEMVRDAGYDLHSSYPDAANYVESIAAGTFYTTAPPVLSALIIDQGVNPPGHRNHLLATGSSESFFSQHTEIGVGMAFEASSLYGRYWSIHTAYRNDTSLRFLTGVVYDDLNDNSRYDEGEGLPGVAVDVAGATATTNAAGGWSLSVVDGEYSVSVSGGGYEGFSSTVATMDGANVEVDFVQGQADGYVNFVQTPGSPPPDPGPDPEPLEVAAYHPLTGQWQVAGWDGENATAAVFAQWGAQNGWSNFRSGDWDGDGDADVAAQLPSGRWYVGLNNGAGAFVAAPAWFWSSSLAREDIAVGDFDGDGAEDLLHRAETGHWYVSRWEAGSFVTQNWETWGANNGWNGTVVGDFTGDGRDDIASRASWGRWYVAVSDGASFSTSSWTIWSTSIGRQNIMAGDFNGDGLDDLVHQTDAGHWYVSQSDGSSFANRYFGFWSPGVERLDMQVADLDGNGRDDIVARTTGGHWYVAESDGDAFVTDYYGKWTDVWRFAVAGDLDGDGWADMAGLRQDGVWRIGLSDGDQFGPPLTVDGGSGGFEFGSLGDFQ